MKPVIIVIVKRKLNVMNKVYYLNHALQLGSGKVQHMEEPDNIKNLKRSFKSIDIEKLIEMLN